MGHTLGSEGSVCRLGWHIKGCSDARRDIEQMLNMKQLSQFGQSRLFDTRAFMGIVAAPQRAMIVAVLMIFMGAVAAQDGACYDKLPEEGGPSCDKHKEWGNCGQYWMVNGGFCSKTCDRCDTLSGTVQYGNTQLPADTVFITPPRGTTAETVEPHVDSNGKTELQTGLVTEGEKAPTATAPQPQPVPLELPAQTPEPEADNDSPVKAEATATAPNNATATATATSLTGPAIASAV